MKKQAKWIVKTHIFRDDEYICSNCGFKTDRPHKTCPSCGVSVKNKDKDLGWVDEAFILDIFDD